MEHELEKVPARQGAQESIGQRQRLCELTLENGGLSTMHALIS